MLYKGLQIVICSATEQLQLPLFQRYLDALVLGALREDVQYLPRKQRIWEHFSLSHFAGAVLPGGFIPFLTPSAASRAQYFFERAIELALQQQFVAAMVQLGRASHLLIDMACPVHAHRVPHWSDGYEWYIEGNGEHLRQLRSSVPSHYRSVREIVTGLAKFTRQFPADTTHHHLGRWLKLRGWRRALTHDEIAAQAEQIIPVASAHLAAMYLHFLAQLPSNLPGLQKLSTALPEPHAVP